MPAWITSELRLEIPDPIASDSSKISTSWPFLDNARAIDSPITPAPTMAVWMWYCWHGGIVLNIA